MTSVVGDLSGAWEIQTIAREVARLLRMGPNTECEYRTHRRTAQVAAESRPKMRRAPLSPA